MWKRYLFKNKSKVWVLVDDRGEPVIDKGRVRIAYSRAAAKLYDAAASNISPCSDPETVSDQEWGQAEPAAGSAGAPSSRPRTRRASSRSSAVKDEARDSVKIYTDGACSGNPGPCSAAAVLKYKDKVKELSRFLGQGTNNIGELEAVRLGLSAIKDPSTPIDLYTDSTYVIGVLTLGWRAKANTQMIAEIRKLVAGFSDLRIHKVKGHSGHPENERVDALAVEAIQLRAGITSQSP